MLIVMENGSSPEDLEGVVAKVASLGFRAHVLHGASSAAVGISGNAGAVDPRPFDVLPGVKQSIPLTKTYKLASREFRPLDTVVPLAGESFGIGGRRFVIIAGPCAIESEEPMLRIAKLVARAGANVLRGGAFKPRPSPYAFQGLAEEGLRILAAARGETGLPIISEALDQAHLDTVCRYVDIVQIGARNMQNFALLRDVGRLDKPVMIERGTSATIDEWLMSAEYVLAEGNPNLMLCESGIRTFSDHTRNTLDLSAVPVVQKLSHLPVLVDPSHCTGPRDKVIPLARAATAVGASGLMVEVHERPDEALSDGPWSLLPDQFESLVRDIRGIAAALGSGT